jgi:2-methylisocitrate lyase-like PEP mutase family enzyme
MMDFSTGVEPCCADEDDGFGGVDEVVETVDEHIYEEAE